LYYLEARCKSCFASTCIYCDFRRWFLVNHYYELTNLVLTMLSTLFRLSGLSRAWSLIVSWLLNPDLDLYGSRIHLPSFALYLELLAIFCCPVVIFDDDLLFMYFDTCLSYCKDSLNPLFAFSSCSTLIPPCAI
jgi:hypothetical protein